MKNWSYKYPNNYRSLRNYTDLCKISACANTVYQTLSLRAPPPQFERESLGTRLVWCVHVCVCVCMCVHVSINCLFLWSFYSSRSVVAKVGGETNLPSLSSHWESGVEVFEVVEECAHQVSVLFIIHWMNVSVMYNNNETFSVPTGWPYWTSSMSHLYDKERLTSRRSLTLCTQQHLHEHTHSHTCTHTHTHPLPLSYRFDKNIYRVRLMGA